MAPNRPRQTYCPPEYENRISALTDLIRWGPSIFSDAEFKMLLYYAERTLVYGKRADASSLAQITEGIFRRKTNEWIRGPAGVGRTAIKKANKSLSRKGLLVRRHSVPGEIRYRSHRGNEATEYEINWAALSAEFGKRKRAPLGHQVTKPLSHVVTKPLGRVVPNNRGKSSSEGEKNRGPSPQKGVRREASASFSENPLLKKADDEKPKPPERGQTHAREPAPTPEKELRLRLEERHGKHYPESVREAWIADAARDLHNANLSLEAFLELDQTQTTNPAGIRNPPAYYRSLVEKLVIAESATALESTLAINLALTEPPKTQPKCEQCVGGRIRFGNDDDLDSYCFDCQLGRELRRYQERETARRAAEMASPEASTEPGGVS